MLNKKIAIVGCGVAGISASIELQKRKIAHTIFEAKRFIGGRFYSFFDPNLDFEIENGQHLFSSAYINFFEILKFLGTFKYLKTSKNLSAPFISPSGKTARLEALTFPNQFGFFLGLFKFPFLSFKSKITLLKLIKKVNAESFSTTNSISVKNFLLSNQQNEEVIKVFWQPIGVTIFNNDLENIPSALFFETFKKAFLGENTSFVFSTLGSSSLLAPFTEVINNSSDYKINLNKKIISIFKEGEKFLVHTNDGEKYEFDDVILCIPPQHLPNILPANWLGYNYFRFLKVLKHNPIVSIYAIFERELFKDDFAFLLDSPFHWIFNKTLIHNYKKDVFLYSFTTSNGWNLLELSNQEIIQLLQTHLEKYFPKIKNNKILGWKIIKDKYATINLDLGFIRNRPKQVSPIDGLYFGGDWTDTNLPATLESSALSGKLAVKALLNKYGLQ
jgi:protoporphyrinogen oxidase